MFNPEPAATVLPKRPPDIRPGPPARAGAPAMKNWDLALPAGKLELALKTLRITANAVDKQWSNAASRDFHEKHMAPIDPSVRALLDAIGQLNDVVTAAERQCESEHE